MTETTSPARTNPHTGRDCPPWCQIDHSKPNMTSCVGSGSEGIHLGPVWARAVIAPDGPLVAVDGVDPDDPERSAYIAVEPRQAGNLATFTELLAGLTPDQHRDLAAAIRRAAAQVTEARDG
jgi:hypothetical protein